MRNYLKVMFIMIAYLCYGQVAVDKLTVDGDGILDFASGTTKGILLPNVQTLPTGFEGTLLYDRNDDKIKYHDGMAWQDLTTDTGYARVHDNTTNDVALSKGVIMGANSSAADGVLILEASNKSLILPKIENPHLTVVNPVAGMICYDTANHLFSIFNGVTWEFWE